MTAGAEEFSLKDELYRLLIMRFSLDELDDLAFRSGFKEGQLWTSEATVSQRSLALVNSCDNRFMLDKLKALMFAIRPDLEHLL